LLKAHTVIVNTTPLGTWPDVEGAPEIPYQYLTNQHLLFDLVYNPAETLFLQKGKAQGAIVKNGQEMLELQAEAAWKIWND
jgi:shikimate dehydrogenase